MGLIAPRRRRLAATVVAALVALGVAGCGSSPNAETPKTTAIEQAWEQPPGMDVTFQWVPGAMLDPLSSEGTFIRTYNGNRRAPSTNMFGDWHVSHFNFIPTDPESGDTPEYAECEAKRTDVPVTPTDQELLDTPEPPLPASPGWPLATT